MNFMSLTLAFIGLCLSVFATAQTNKSTPTNTYISCGSKKTTYRLIVSHDAGYKTMQVFKRGRSEPVVDAAAAMLFRRCVESPCQQVPIGIKTIDSSPSYNLSLPWRAMESDNKFTAVLTEQIPNRLGQTISKTYNILCQPGVKNNTLIASTKTNK